MKKYLCTAAIFLSVTGVSADEFVIGLGEDDFGGNTGDNSLSIVLEYHLDPFFAGRRSTYSWAGAVELDEDDDIYVGVGVHARWRLADGPWFLEASFMPGYYDQGQSGNDLGGNLQFRSLLGVGYELKSGNKISVAIDHKSNGSIEDQNPGEEMLVLRYSFNF